MPGDRVMDEVRAALAATDYVTAQPSERAEMLMEIPISLQTRPKTIEQLREAVSLYGKAPAICPGEDSLLCARITARKATALQAVPENGVTFPEHARALPGEVAEAAMNLGGIHGA
jgi:hypothetical protein